MSLLALLPPFRSGAGARRRARETELPVHVGGAIYGATANTPARVLGFDQALIGVCIALLSFGIVMVYSASIAMPESPRFAQFPPTYFLLRHVLWIGISLVVALAVFQVRMDWWQRVARAMFVLSLVLLAIVLIPHVGTMVNGSRRWLGLGPLRVQPSEIAKLTVLLYASDYMVRKMDVKERFFRAVLPMAVAIGVVGSLLLAQPDMGAFLVIAVIAMSILFLGGVNARMFFLIAAILVVAFALMIWSSPWRRDRIFAYLDPFSMEHALGRGYQLSHALIAIGRGGLFGVGLGRGIEKLNWLPEAHTDFLLAVIGEEFGLIGLLCVIFLFFWLTRRIIMIGRQAIALDRIYSGLVAQAIGLWLGFQAFINIGVNLGALPTKGLTLPFMSYGGSAILLNIVAIAIVMRVDAENRQLMRGGRV